MKECDLLWRGRGANLSDWSVMREHRLTNLTPHISPSSSSQSSVLTFLHCAFSNLIWEHCLTNLTPHISTSSSSSSQVLHALDFSPVCIFKSDIGTTSNQSYSTQASPSSQSSISIIIMWEHFLPSRLTITEDPQCDRKRISNAGLPEKVK